MKIYNEMSLTDFEFWAGALDTVKYLTREDLEILTAIFEEMFPDGIDAMQVNDMFWHEPDTIADWLGYDDFEALMER